MKEKICKFLPIILIIASVVSCAISFVLKDSTSSIMSCITAWGLIITLYLRDIYDKLNKK